jgi:2-polyprenyl-6-hydroxyphenyl methylase/3-demethylubiquinone-9 3-methyltransferase
VIKGVEWCVPNAPKNMHVYPLFIKPKELKEMMAERGLESVKMHGFTPKIFSTALIKMVFQRKVPNDFQFRFSNNLATGYCGLSQKRKS